MIKEKWFIRTKKADFAAVGKKYNISPVLARIIRNRDICSNEDIDTYLNGTVDKMYSPWLFRDMDKAVDILLIKINQRNKIRVISDYDIDGICSGFVLLDALKKAGADVDIVVPHRIQDGYGISEKLIDDACEDQIDTIITCDNGIAAFSAVEHAKELGITIIITDHHEVQDREIQGKLIKTIPNADAVIDHKQIDCKYPFKDLCGAGVAYKLMEALYETMGLDINSLKSYLEYVAIATIGDVVSLTDENRIITKYGLNLLKHSSNLGLCALMEECRLDKNKIDAYKIGFVLGPCLNASGRLDTAKKGIELLKTNTKSRAQSLARDLKNLNDERKNMTENQVQAAEIVAEQCQNDRVLVLYLPDCHESIAGIVAGRIKELYNKPTLVITRTEDGAKGSGRSIEAYDMFEELSKCIDLFTRFGGHKMAAGFSLPIENIEKLKKRLNEFCTLSDEDLLPKVWIDMELPLSYLNLNLIEQLSILEPFGQGNSKPTFAARNLKIKKLSTMGAEGKHIKLLLADQDGTTIDGVLFNKSTEFINFIKENFGDEQLKKASRGVDNDIKIKIIYYPQINDYYEIPNLQVVIKNYCI